MKNLFLNLLLVLSAAVFVVSCNEAEVEDYRYGNFRNIFEVRSASNSNFVYLAPAYSDTVYAVSSDRATDFSYKTGDRVYLDMGWEWDTYSTSSPTMCVNSVIAKSTPRVMREKAGFDPSLYNSPFSSTNLVSFGNMDGTEAHGSDFIWGDAETQNVCVRYDEGLTCEPALVLDSLRNQTLYFRLYANLEDKGWPDDETFVLVDDPGKVCKILSFKMDWDFIKNELTTLEQSELEKCEYLTSFISLVREGCEKDDKGLYKAEGGYTFDEFLNPLYINE